MGATTAAVSKALEKAGDELVMRRYLLDKREEEQRKVDYQLYLQKKKRVVSIKPGSSAVRLESSDDEEEEEDDEEVLRLQQKRIAQLMQKEVERGSRHVEEIQEREFLSTVLAHDFCIVHFYHRAFEKCEVMDLCLNQVAQEHGETQFARIEAEKAPFFIAKLGIRVLPSVLVFEHGVLVDRITGFEGIANGIDITAKSVEARLMQYGAIFCSKEVLGKNVQNGTRLPRKLKKTLSLSEF